MLPKPTFLVNNNINNLGRETVCCYEADVAKETLGVFLAMDATTCKKAEIFADCIQMGFLSCEDAMYALGGNQDGY
jgi:hypothetical protein